MDVTEGTKNHLAVDESFCEKQWFMSKGSLGHIVESIMWMLENI